MRAEHTASHQRRDGSALLLATSPPGAPAGSSSRAAVVLDALHDRFARVDVVSLSALGDERRVDPGVYLVPWSRSPSRWAYATSLVRGGSPFVGVRASKLSQRLRELAENGELSQGYDLVWSHFLITAPAAVAVPAVARVLDADFALSAAAKRAVGGASWMQRIYLGLDVAAITRQEHRFCALFDHIVVASELERERLGHVRCPVTVVPNVVPDHRSDRAVTHRRDGLLFVGTLDYDVNVDAVEFLVREVFPRVRSQMPAAELTIVGRNPDEELLRLAHAPGVTLIPDAPSLEPFYSNARAVVVPLRAGGGTRIKVLEAMARSIAIVATPAGLEGLRLRHGTDALVAADPGELAEHCVALLEDAALADRLGRNARAVWSADHRPSAARGAILRVLDSVLPSTVISPGVGGVDR